MKKLLVTLIFTINFSNLKSSSLSEFSMKDSRAKGAEALFTIFGNEIGAILRSPTAVFSCEGDSSFFLKGDLSTQGILLNLGGSSFSFGKGNLVLGDIAALFRIGNFVGGLYTPFFSMLPTHDFPIFSLNFLSLAYSLKFNAFSFGLSNTSTFLKDLSPKSSSIDISAMYESSIGIFNISLNDSISINFENWESVFYRNLILAYGREFKIFSNNLMRIGIEIMDLLFPFQGRLDQYNFTDKVKIGAEFLIKNDENAKFIISLGLNNLLPTGGLSMNIFNVIEAGVSFHNEKVFSEYGPVKSAFFTLFSLKIGYF